MGRGLSPEQKQVLIRAAQPPAPKTPAGVDLLARDAIEAVYPGLRYCKESRHDLERIYDSSGVHIGARRLHPYCYEEVWKDSPELRRAKAAISRTFRRLEERGLVKRMEAAYSRWAGIKLTERGREVAEHLVRLEG